MIHINTENLKEFNILDNNYYIIADFDHTLTTANSVPTMGVLPNFLGGDFLEKRLKLYEHYRPIELDYNLAKEEKQKLMKEWAQNSFSLTSKYITNNVVKESLNSANLYFRTGVKEFLEEANKNNIPVIIMSSGIGNIVKAFLEKEKCLFNNIEVISNFFLFNDNGAYIDLKNIMASSNKHYSIIPESIRKELEKRSKAIVMGDLIEDKEMIDAKKVDKIITIGFLDSKIEENLKEYNNNFDIVLTNNENFNTINKILKGGI